MMNTVHEMEAVRNKAPMSRDRETADPKGESISFLPALCPGEGGLYRKVRIFGGGSRQGAYRYGLDSRTGVYALLLCLLGVPVEETAEEAQGDLETRLFPGSEEALLYICGRHAQLSLRHARREISYLHPRPGRIVPDPPLYLW